MTSIIMVIRLSSAAVILGALLSACGGGGSGGKVAPNSSLSVITVSSSLSYASVSLGHSSAADIASTSSSGPSDLSSVMASVMASVGTSSAGRDASSDSSAVLSSSLASSDRHAVVSSVLAASSGGDVDIPRSRPASSSAAAQSSLGSSIQSSARSSAQSSVWSSVQSSTQSSVQSSLASSSAMSSRISSVASSVRLSSSAASSLRASSVSSSSAQFSSVQLSSAQSSVIQSSSGHFSSGMSVVASSSTGFSASSSVAPPQACVTPQADNQWAGASCAQAPVNACVSGTWVAPATGERGEPLRTESAHFAVYWPDGTTITLAEAEAALVTLERVWDTYMGTPLRFPEPYCNSAVKHKATVHFDNDFPLWGGSWVRNNVSYMGMWIGPAAAKDAWGLAHEFMHGLQTTTTQFAECGGVACWIYESHANWMAHQVFPDNVHCSEMLPNSAHLHYGNTRNRYCNWQFFEYLKDKHCASAVNHMWSSNAPSGQRDPFQKLMYSQQWDIEQLNDRFGEWAMHNVTWDYHSPDGRDQGSVYRREYGAITDTQSAFTARRLRLTQLETLDANWASTRRFASPYHWAPQRWGYNVIELIPESGATQIAVDFRGLVQAGANSGWRWGIVTTNSSLTEARYTPIQRDSAGRLEVCISAGEKVFLVVLAAPTQYQKIVWGNDADGTAYPSIYRYPYLVQLEGAWPKGFSNGTRDACPSGTQRHANGGGCATPSTPASVYVGPYAKVVGGQVSGTARIEDHATVINATVSGGSVGGLTLLGVAAHAHHGPSHFTVREQAQVRASFYPLGWFGAQQAASGSAKLLGDLEYYASDKTAGWFYGLVDDTTSARSVTTEVTLPPPYYWPTAQ